MPLDAVTATAGLNANVIAWQQEPGSGAGDIRIRYAGNGVSVEVRNASGAEVAVPRPWGAIPRLRYAAPGLVRRFTG